MGEDDLEFELGALLKKHADVSTEIQIEILETFLNCLDTRLDDEMKRAAEENSRRPEAGYDY